MSLVDQLRGLLASRRREVADAHTRVLPFGDYVSDRWDKARALGFGDGTSVYDSCHVFGEVIVGQDTWIGPFTILDGTGGLRIGSNCSISAGVQIYSHDTVQWAKTGGQAPYEYAPTVIGNNCYIGPNTVVGKGVTIGSGAVVGANSLVLSDIPAGSTAHGNPARAVPAPTAS